MKLSLIEVSFSWLNENLFLLKLHNKRFLRYNSSIKSRTILIFPHPVRILGYCFNDSFHLELQSNVAFGVDNLKKHNVYIFTGFVALTTGTKLFKW